MLSFWLRIRISRVSAAMSAVPPYALRKPLCAVRIHGFEFFLKKEFDTYIRCAYKPASPTGWMTFQGQFENRIEESDREKWAIVSFMSLVETFRETSRQEIMHGCNDHKHQVP